MRRGIISLVWIGAAAAVVAGCAQRPADHVLTRSLSPDGGLEAVTMLCANPADRSVQRFVGAVYRTGGEAVECSNVAASPAVLTWFAATLVDEGATAADTVAWTADNRAVFDIHPRRVTSRTTAAGVAEGLMQVRSNTATEAPDSTS